jgi:predicted MFS family arabinose efflux permease
LRVFLQPARPVGTVAEQHIQLPRAGFSTLLHATGVGVLLGAFIFGVFTQNYKEVRLLFVSYLIRGVGDILIAWSMSFPFVLLLFFCV